MDLKTFDPKIKNLLKKEITLKNKYTKLTAGAKIEFQGKTYNLAGLGPFHTDKNRLIRKTPIKLDTNGLKIIPVI